MKTKKSAVYKAQIPASKLPRATKHAARKVVRRSLPQHKRILAHPATIFLLLCIGVLIVDLTYKSVADTISISAKVSAPFLSEGAIITDPAEGHVFTTIPITVTGTCPDNSYVNLYRNSAFSGSAWCVSNTFSIVTSLSSGTNTLLAQDFNITDDPGPVTTSINVIYTPPVIPPSSGTGSGSGGGTTGSSNGSSSHHVTPANSNVAPLLLTSSYHFKTFSITNPFKWDLEINGGLPPYSIRIEWGDGTKSFIKYSGQKLTISHIYKSIGYYPVIIQATDSQGDTAVIQLAALIKTPGTIGFTTKSTPKPVQTVPSFAQRIYNWLWLIWPSYGVVMLMALSFWLGERQEVLELARTRYSRKRYAQKRRHA